MGLIALDTVFETYAANRQETGNPELMGSLEISGGEVNIYFSNDDAEPANAAAMTIDADGPYLGTRVIASAALWVLVESASGAPVVNGFRVTA